MKTKTYTVNANSVWPVTNGEAYTGDQWEAVAEECRLGKHAVIEVLAEDFEDADCGMFHAAGELLAYDPGAGFFAIVDLE